MTARPQRVFSVTALGPDVPLPVREALQAFAQSIDQLVSGFLQVTPATTPTDITDGGPAGNFNGVFCIGTFGAANTATAFTHSLGRTPIGAFELMAIPQADQLKPPVAQVASAIALLSASNNQITMTSTAANRQFTLILM